MTQALIPNPFVRWHFRDFQKRGYSIEQICQQFSVPETVFTSEGKDVSADGFAEMIKQSVVAIDDESFGGISTSLPVGSFRMMTYACITCQTLKQAIHRTCNFYRLLSKQINWRLDIGEQQSKLVFDTNLAGTTGASHNYFIIFTSCIIWRWLSWMIDKPIELSQLTLNFSPAYASSYLPGLFKTQVHFEREESAIYFDNSLLDMPVKQTPDSLQTFLINAPQCLMSHYQSSMSLTKKVQEYLEDAQYIGETNLPHAAEHFFCSEQSLIRGLKQEGTRFKDIREKVRKQKASYYLVKTKLTNQQISAQLGFSEVSVFYRNFKKWFGVTPSQYRENPQRASQHDSKAQ
ncbi:AraC family transcriptional regulator ligand-binding domain-containing protein [Thalassotalea sp. LPB0316]|uniref:AraC family transcriptional regulator n=1 Tax=Thalassotalea sp. LPB0316 TaxID=2769490 RepID=UPI0018689E41|nr:AraC family transcriptional regulator [Thalassotalea sp. LPB0316]QOL25848.1 AraC family transcriptional regulator ligand-binding domain-containing protein [Thalassotalea sp. LPB0316]